VVTSDRPTTVKTRVIAQHQQVVRFDVERAHPLEANTTAELVERLPASFDGLVVSDYGKGVVDSTFLRHVLGHAAAAEVPVAVDPKDPHFFEYRGVNVITPNLAEASRALGRPLAGDDAVEAGGRELCRRLAAQSVLITRGEEGMSLVTRDGAAHLPAVAEDVFDVTGAGDTVVSVFALAMAAGATLVECAGLSNRAASLSVREVGTASVSPIALAATFGVVLEPDGSGG
jgi:D-beta-D-heptose 7-phosphate kinase/D-beta-D-heptose 1-phosphate adenosyltransferase